MVLNHFFFVVRKNTLRIMERKSSTLIIFVPTLFCIGKINRVLFFFCCSLFVLFCFICSIVVKDMLLLGRALDHILITILLIYNYASGIILDSCAYKWQLKLRSLKPIFNISGLFIDSRYNHFHQKHSSPVTEGGSGNLHSCLSFLLHWTIQPILTGW